MLDRYKVSAQVDSAKFGKGELIAYLDHEDFVKYANLSDQDKLAFLKEHGAQLQVDLADLKESDITDFQVNLYMSNEKGTTLLTKKGPPCSGTRS